jgi:hypothetical protein
MVFAFFELFGWVPQDLKNIFIWISHNTTQFIVGICFLAVLYVIFRIKMRERRNDE